MQIRNHEARAMAKSQPGGARPLDAATTPIPLVRTTSAGRLAAFLIRLGTPAIGALRRPLLDPARAGMPLLPPAPDCPRSTLTLDDRAAKSRLMSDIAAPWIVCEGLAGLRAQALGLAEAAGLTPEIRELKPAAPWKWVAAKLWPNPLAAVAEAVKAPLPALAIGCGGMAGAVLAALRRQSMRVVQVQNPRMAINRFDLIIANQHDELTGPNVFVVRTALHRVTPARLAVAADAWRDRLAPYRRPLVAVLLGGSNGRFRLDRDAGAKLAADLATMAQRDKVGVVVTPSRRTDPAVTDLIRTALAPTGGWVWNFEGENPYFGMLALADLIVVTQDSVSMISEAAATTAPVMVATLPGHWQRQGLFLKPLINEDRIRPFEGRFSTWPVTPLNDTPAAAAEMRRRLGFSSLGL
jgi:mitochondrial fission protein ELM1